MLSPAPTVKSALCTELAAMRSAKETKLSSSGKYLQQRSALTLLKAALDAHANDVADSVLSPVGLWTVELQQEFESIEEGAAHGTLLQSYNSVCAKFDDKVSLLEKQTTLYQGELVFFKDTN